MISKFKQYINALSPKSEKQQRLDNVKKNLAENKAYRKRFKVRYKKISRESRRVLNVVNDEKYQAGSIMIYKRRGNGSGEIREHLVRIIKPLASGIIIQMTAENKLGSDIRTVARKNLFTITNG